MHTIEEFTINKPITRTLMMKLIPQGRTEEYIQQDGILKKDKQRADDYEDVKLILDDYYKNRIEESFDCFLRYIRTNEGKTIQKHLNDLIQTYTLYLQDKATYRKQFFGCQKFLREDLAKHGFENHEDAKQKNNQVFDKVYKSQKDEEKKDKMSRFKSFELYFDNYFENRKNLFSSENKASAVANRIVNENLPKYLNNARKWERIRSQYPDLMQTIRTESEAQLNIGSFEDMFNPSLFFDFLKQKRIEDYNMALGGNSSSDDRTKIKGVNECINLYCQTHTADVKRKDLVMIPLFKQILSDRESRSVYFKPFDSETELKMELKEYVEKYAVPAFEQIAKLFTKQDASSDTSGIYLSDAGRRVISQKLFSNWNTLDNAVIFYEISKLSEGKKKTQVMEKVAERKSKEKYLDVQYLAQALVAYETSETGLFPQPVTLDSYFTEKLTEQIRQTIGSMQTLGTYYNDSDSHIRKDAKLLATVKEGLDAMIETTKVCQSFIVPEDYNPDETFYNEFKPAMEELFEASKLYDRIRNYATKKVEPAEKFKLNFSSSTLGNGWDKNKEPDNLCVILKKDNKYYLGIMRKEKCLQPDFADDSFHVCEGQPFYEKMEYKSLPDTNKMFPKVFFAKKKAVDTPIPPVLDETIRRKRVKTAEYWSPNYASQKEFETALIEFYKKAAPLYPGWDVYDFKFKETASYADLTDFTDDASHQAYKLSYVKLFAKAVDNLVEDGRLYLFEIYNKDYAPGAHGNKNLHTIYWEEAMKPSVKGSPVTAKLNGYMTLFMRPSLKEEPVVHKKGTILVNRNLKDGTRLSDEIHNEIYRYMNGRIPEYALSKESKAMLPQIITKTLVIDRVKDKRFYQNQYEFHVPISFNPLGEEKEINDKVVEAIREDDSINIIGIDRGEKNLVYISVIDKDRNILLQKALNSIESTKPGKGIVVDYQSKLVEAEKAREVSRKSWMSIGKIADLKTGYLSYVIHEVSSLMVKYNAILVLEDLNKGFKRGRMKFERQVYQKFEGMLINKLNYLVFKDCDPPEPGSVCNGLQLTDKFNGFDKMTKQTGWLFYIPASYTSKIDPVTGFANIFILADLTNVQKKNNFFSKFQSIVYNPTEKVFELTFDYNKFKCAVKRPQGDVWTITSSGTRICYDPKQKKQFIADPTSELKRAFDDEGIPFENGEELVSAIKKMGADKTHVPFYDALYRAFKEILQLRNSNTATGEDYIYSPVAGADGKHYDSRLQTANSNLPCDADANGAYNIARKGLMIIDSIRKDGAPDFMISNEKWFHYVTGR